MSSSSSSNSNGSASTEQQPIVLKPATFVKVSALEPGTKGHNLVVRVGDVKTLINQARYDGTKLVIGEALVGDETGSILFTVRNEQLNQVKKDSSIVLRNAKIEMYKDHMRLAVDKWGLIEPSKTNIATINTSQNLSDTEYELVEGGK